MLSALTYQPLLPKVVLVDRPEQPLERPVCAPKDKMADLLK